jgi:hypothetical protein
LRQFHATILNAASTNCSPLEGRRRWLSALGRRWGFWGRSISGCAPEHSPDCDEDAGSYKARDQIA